MSLFMICDGHGIKNGEIASKYVTDNLPGVLLSKIQNGADPVVVLTETFVELNDQILQRPDMDNTGTTVTVALVEGNRLTVANVGDTEAIVERDGKPVILTTPHKAYLEEERIEAAGGQISAGKVVAQNGIRNAVSRSLGEKNLGSPYIIPTPDITITDLESGDSRLIIACDGLWDTMEKDESLNVIRGIAEPQQAAEKLVDEAANKRFSADNVSAIVVNLSKL